MGKLFITNKGGDSLGGMVFCSSCLEKQQKIDRLEEENASLRAKLRYREKKDLQEFFGSSTPSSKKKFKEKSSKENQENKGHKRYEKINFCSHRILFINFFSDIKQMNYRNSYLH